MVLSAVVGYLLRAAPLLFIDQLIARRPGGHLMGFAIIGLVDLVDLTSGSGRLNLVFEYAPLIALATIGVTSLAIFITAQWRLGIIMLAIQYLGVFLLVSLTWPLSMAVVKLVAGWMAGAVIGMAMLSVPELRRELNVGTNRLVTSRPFYFIAALLVWIVVISQVNNAVDWFPDLQPTQAWGALLLIGMGLMKLGFTDHPLQATLGILTALSGFEILYATIETSALIAGLLAGVTLGIALAGTYLLMAPHLEEI